MPRLILIIAGRIQFIAEWRGFIFEELAGVIMIWTVFWKKRFSVRDHRVASFTSFGEALKFCQILQSDGGRITEVVGPCGETLGANLSELLASRSAT